MDQKKEEEQTAEKKGEQDSVSESEKPDPILKEKKQPEQQALEKKSEDHLSANKDPFDEEEPKAVKDDPTHVLSAMTHEERKLFLSMAGLSSFAKSTGRLFWTNFLMGLARGIGFVIGMSIIGAVCVTVWNEFLSVTGIGQFIARLIEEINKNTPVSP